MDKFELQDRTKKFALRVARLVATLPNMPFGRTIANQIIRSATSVAANYRAACRGRSRAEFIAKLGITIEEADESLFWLELAIAGKLVKKELVKSLLDEANEITAILVASRKSATKNKSTIGNLKS